MRYFSFDISNMCFRVLIDHNSQEFCMIGAIDDHVINYQVII